MTTFSFCILFFMSTFSGSVQDEVKHTKDSFEKIKENIKSKKAVMVDVREKNEWDAGHLKGAKLVPWSKIRFAPKKKKLKELPDDGIIVYCHCKAGSRALKAAKKLKSLGYEVRPIKAGFDELVENGFEKGKSK
jgi:phage shock protein E